jgi:hypothetical protein
MVLGLLRHGKGIISVVEAFIEAEDAIDYGKHRGLADAPAVKSTTAIASTSPPRVPSTVTTTGSDHHG